MPNDPIEEEIKRLTREWSENWPTQWRVGVELRALVRRVREDTLREVLAHEGRIEELLAALSTGGGAEGTRENAG